MHSVIHIGNSPPRLKVRRVDEQYLLQDKINKAKETGNIQLYAAHGGSVCNSYGYKADTEGVVAIAFPCGCGVSILNRLAANKVTLAGVGGDLWDKRITDKERKQEARYHWISTAINILEYDIDHFETFLNTETYKKVLEAVSWYNMKLLARI